MRRRVYYLAGLDPRGARFYHQLYAEESSKQTRVNGSVIRTGPLESDGSPVSSWRVEASWNDVQVETDYRFLDWEDLMRENWGRLAGTRQLGRYLWYVAAKSWRVRHVSRYFFHTTLVPVYYLLLLLLCIALTTGLVLWGTAVATGSQGLASGLAVITAAAFVYGGWRYAKHVRILWLFRVCSCVLDWSEKTWPKLDERIAWFAAGVIEEQEDNPVDEVLIVGHSIGAILAVQLAEHLLRKDTPAIGGMHLMTIGSSIPFLGVLPGAEPFRRSLAKVASDSRLDWTDFTAIKDILCFFKANPVEACGVAPVIKDRPRSFPLRIYRMFSPERYASVQRDHLRVHLQYLMAGELATEYDYFSITAGPERLAAYRKTK